MDDYLPFSFQLNGKLEENWNVHTGHSNCIILSLKLLMFLSCSLDVGTGVYRRHRGLCQHSTRQPAKRTHSAPVDIDHCIICCSSRNLDIWDLWYEHPLCIIRNEWGIWALCRRHYSILCVALLCYLWVCQMEKAAWFMSPLCHLL